jgi:hypothetical protein
VHALAVDESETIGSGLAPAIVEKERSSPALLVVVHPWSQLKAPETAVTMP